MTLAWLTVLYGLALFAGWLGKRYGRHYHRKDG